MATCPFPSSNTFAKFSLSLLPIISTDIFAKFSHPYLLGNKMEDKMKDTLVLFPGGGMGHIIPCIELAKLFIRQNLTVSIVILEIPFFTLSNVDKVVSSHPTINFYKLPPIPLPPVPPGPFLLFELLRLAKPHIRDYVATLTNVRALILDMFCTDGLDVANELNIPSYIFFTSGAACLAQNLYFPFLQSEMSSVANFKDIGDTLLYFPGLPPLPASHLPELLKDRNNDMCKRFVYHYSRFPKANGIVINTLEELETTAVKAIVDGHCVQPDQTVPPIYCIGPLIAEGGAKEEAEKHECLMWLDQQPCSSVVFLCFGSSSMGSFKVEQLREIADGLERSGQRFLWVVKSPPSTDPKQMFAMQPPPDFDALLPEGFVERNKDKGMVLKLWAPQVAVLSHEAVGAFVTHCGWNSVLEAVTCGVAMIAWPLYAEQRLNKVVLVEDAKLAVEMEGYDKEMVSAEEVEKKVRWVIETEEGKQLRERAAAMKEKVVAAKKEGGSSEKASRKLVEAITG